jgi:hypothetical protein
VRNLAKARIGQISVPLTISVLMLVSVACGPCSLLSGPSVTPMHPIIVSTEAAGQLEARMRQSLGGPLGQEFILSITDAEITSLLAVQLARHETSPIREPQVWFSEGKVYGTGRLTNIVPIESDLALVASVQIHDGKLRVDIEEAFAGSLPLPPSALTVLSQSLNQTVAELQWGVHVTGLDIVDGQAIVRGQRQ